MRIGSLDQMITIQRPGTARDEIGQPIPSWEDVAVGVWANIRYQSGVEAIRADAPTSTAKVSIQIRKRAGVKADMRAVDAAGVVYEIKSVLSDMQTRDRINLTCEVVNG